MQPVRRSSRVGAGARMNDTTVVLPARMKRKVAMWLAWRGYFYFDLPAWPLAAALGVMDPLVTAVFDVLRGEDGEREIRQVARDLQDFVRNEWDRLQHRFDVAAMAQRFRLPLDDVKFWLQQHPPDMAFVLYEGVCSVMERLLIMEAMEDNISAQLARQQKSVCSLCGIELFVGQVCWRELTWEQQRFRPPHVGPDPEIHAVRISVFREKERVSVCSACKTRDPALNIPPLDPIPQAVSDIPRAYRHYLSVLSLWMKRDHGQGFAKQGCQLQRLATTRLSLLQRGAISPFSIMVLSIVRSLTLRRVSSRHPLTTLCELLP